MLYIRYVAYDIAEMECFSGKIKQTHAVMPWVQISLFIFLVSYVLLLIKLYKKHSRRFEPVQP